MVNILETAEKIGGVVVVFIKIIVLIVAIVAIYEGRQSRDATTRDRAVIMRALTVLNDRVEPQTMEVNTSELMQ